jgi:prepilin-type N-terminal cleavage/methylation domain-containing protein
MNKQKKEKGFTIIEVVLVLAIAGLIFLMVFIALPALQRNQRDSQRKGDLSRLQTALTSYTSNNRGSLPTSWTSFVDTYLTLKSSTNTSGTDSFVDPSGPSTTQGSNTTTYELTPSSADLSSTSFSTAQNIIYYAIGAVCDPNTGGAVTTTGAGARKVAFRMVLEGGGVTCLNN